MSVFLIFVSGQIRKLGSQYPGFSLGRLHMGGGQVQGDKALMGGLMRGDIDLMGGPNFDRLYHKLNVMLMLSFNYMMQFID